MSGINDSGMFRGAMFRGSMIRGAMIQGLRVSRPVNGGKSTKSNKNQACCQGV